MPSPRSSAHSISNNRIDRAGALLRDWWADLALSDELDADHLDRLLAASDDFFPWRDTFRYPLTKVVNGLRSFVKSECPPLREVGATLPVGQRLKREPQILRKLARYPTMRLSRMQDIGGCRAIMPGGASEIYGVLNRIRDRWAVIDVYDYIERPQDTGYRAIHVVVVRDERRIEIQLRTPGQHEWAEVVERTGLRHRMPLKEGGGDPDLLRYFALAAHGIAFDERGEPADKEFMTEFADARDRVRHFFRNPIDA